MSRRLNPCRLCKPVPPGANPFVLKRGFTRHDDRRCSRCRQHGPTAAAAQLPRTGSVIRPAAVALINTVCRPIDWWLTRQQRHLNGDD